MVHTWCWRLWRRLLRVMQRSHQCQVFLTGFFKQGYRNKIVIRLQAWLKFCSILSQFLTARMADCVCTIGQDFHECHAQHSSSAFVRCAAQRPGSTPHGCVHLCPHGIPCGDITFSHLSRFFGATRSLQAHLCSSREGSSETRGVLLACTAIKCSDSCSCFKSVPILLWSKS